MAIIKCKMCGGDLEIAVGLTVAECEYCGTKQTVPTTNSEVIRNLYNRANNLRIKCEFDKAEQTYEKILQENDAESEAHWGIVLCKYGIEYVEDPKTYKRIPTCHRTSFDAVITDADYLAAIANADAVQKSVYEAEAKTIDSIQKSILDIAKNETPFDVFICYKETDEYGKRTIDSSIANDIYHQLTQEGLKVFYAAITLEDKLGREYEPYIFAALNSAKVMLVVGTKPEYFSAVWVKNEWSRFLKLMKSDRSKLLIPCYKDMDAYDLPEEFSHLQAQDMSKIGFINDVVRGIKKITVKDESKDSSIKDPASTGTNTSVAPLLKRVFLFLEDGDWNSADEYCEKILDIDPECAEAYLGKLMVELNVPSRQMLKNCLTPFNNSNNFQKAIRFADNNIKDELQGYIDFIEDRNLSIAYNKAEHVMMSAKQERDYKNAAKMFEALQGFKDSVELSKVCLEKAEESRLAACYDDALASMNSAKTEQNYKSAARKFNAIKSFRDSEEMEKICIEKAAEAEEKYRKDTIYSFAISYMEESTVPSFQKAIELFESIEDWKDSSSMISDCESRIYKLEQEEVALHIEAARLAEKIRIEKEKNAEKKRIEAERIAKEQQKVKKKRKTILVLSILIVCAALIVCIPIAYKTVLNTVIIPNGKYNDALLLMAEEKYSEAITAFNEISEYKDSIKKIDECKTAILDKEYNNAVSLMMSKNYAEALAVFKTLSGYKNSVEHINECKNKIHEEQYNNAADLLKAGKLYEAHQAFVEISDYKDSLDKAKEILTTISLREQEIGDTVVFGAYEQDGKESNGKEELEWLVLDKQDNKMLVISRYILDCQKFHEIDNEADDIVWENSSLRDWLNHDFIDSAFSEEEKNRIIYGLIPFVKNPEFGTYSGGTYDQLFLLSLTDLNTYFESDSARICESTKYAKAQGVSTDSRGASCWWLRTPGSNNARHINVTNIGSVDTYGASNRVINFGVRPAMWIDLNV